MSRLNTPEEAARPVSVTVPANLETRSVIDSFFVVLSLASTIAILSAETSTTAALRSFMSSVSFPELSPIPLLESLARY